MKTCLACGKKVDGCRHYCSDACLPVGLVIDGRFWSKIKNSSWSSCWPWLAGTDKDGYGNFEIRRNGEFTCMQAHRIVWEVWRGPIPSGMCVCHHCDNRACCNPLHLFVDTNSGNMEDRDSKGRQAKGKRHGLYGNGHLVAGEKSGMHKFTWSDIPMVRLLAAVGASYPFIAKRYGVTSQAVRPIVIGKAWKEPPETEEYITAMYEEAA
jgi:hypothetical protein